MSGEYYSKEEPVAKFYKDIDVSPRSVINKDTYEPPKQGHRLHDIEEQLEMAENHCNTLKGRLDYMKQVYGDKKGQPKSRKISNISPDRRVSDDNLSISSASVTSVEGKAVQLKRQNSNAISTDNSGAAVRTINNILNGITDSVNRLSELHVQISESPRSRKLGSTTNSPHAVNVYTSKNKKETTQKDLSTESDGALDIHLENSTRVSNKSRNIKKKTKESRQLHKKAFPHHTLKRTVKEDRKAKTNVASATVLNKTSANLSKRKMNYKPTTQAKNLVEIYHNHAVKNCDSEEYQINRNPRYIRRRPEVLRPLEDIPLLEISQKPEILQIQDGSEEAPYTECENVVQNVDVNNYYDPPEAPRTLQSYCSKNYELPTIASRMKQVAKCYLNTFNFKAIPFCAAISTSPSHNIGINIQQVMNIIKNRQPVNGISPTLAHNIGLAAERLNSRPLSALVSTINSKTCYRPTHCPLSKSILNYNQLQDMAKIIPEETAEEVEGEEDSPEVNTVVITGPSGDMEVKNANNPVWTVDSSQSQQCTCVTQSGVDFQQVMNKYRKNMTPMTSQTIVSQKAKRWDKYATKWNTGKSFTKRPKTIKNGYVEPINGSKELPQENPLQGKERNLKEVLTNLHDEFESLNKRYEYLSQKANSDDEETLKELEQLEAELNKKEEEITMVMTLYKEVLALKQQIKTLKEKTSQASVNIQEQKEASSNFKEYNNPQAAFHLTKLLRQIQMYQMRYKKDGVGV